MVRKFYKVFLFAFVMSAGFVSCKSDDGGVFNELPSVREGQRASELKDLLNSSEEGWKVTYFTDNKELGGFTFLMRFAPSGKVEMISDFNEEGYQLQTSDYEIQLRGTTSLVFVTENKIHKLSDPMDSPTSVSLGYKGEFQFRYYGNSENEIEFRGTKDVNQVIRFVKATANDWDKFENRKPIHEFYNDLYSPIFKALEVTKGGETTLYDGVLGMRSRFFAFNEKNDNLGNAAKGFGLSYTNDGAVISPAVVIDGEEHAEFKWDASKTELVSVNGGDTKIAIKNVISPSKWEESYKTVVNSVEGAQLGFFTNDEIYGGPGNSKIFKEAITDDENKPVVAEISLIFQNGFMQALYKVGTAKYTYTGKIKDTNGRITFDGANWSANATASIKELHEKVIPASGFYLKKQSYKVKYSNAVYTVYSGKDTSSFDTWDL